MTRSRPGDVDQPLTEEALAASFRMATTDVIGEERAHRLHRMLTQIEDHRLDDLMPILILPQ